MSEISHGSSAERARPALVASVAGASCGSWAGFAHHTLGLGVALRAGLTQVVLSLTATVVLALVLERLFRRQSNPLRGFWFAAGGTSMLGTAWLVVGHALAGTPHIAVTITPPMILGAVFSFAYARTLFVRAARGGEFAAALITSASGPSNLPTPTRPKRAAWLKGCCRRGQVPV